MPDLAVHFATPAIEDIDLVHRIRNFADDLERTLESSGIGEVRNKDAARSEVLVSVRSVRLVGSAKTEISAQLKRHNLENLASIVRS